MNTSEQKESPLWNKTIKRVQSRVSPIDTTDGVHNHDANWTHVAHNLGFLTAKFVTKGRLNQQRDKHKRSGYIISHGNLYRVMWDLLVCVCLLYIFIFTPMEIVYGDSLAEGFFAYLGAMVDLVFWIDIVVCFRTTYVDFEGETVWDSHKIARNYFKGFFFVDLLSCAPGFPLNYFLMRSSGSSGAGALKLAKTARVLKVVRSIQIMRVLRLLKIGFVFKKVQEFIIENEVVMQIIRLLLTTSLFLHIDACCFSAVAKLGSDPDRDSWVAVYGLRDESWQTEYLYALYWSAATSTTVGYGDLVPQSKGEKIFGVISMCIGVGLYGYIVGSLTQMIASTSFVETQFSERMDEVNEFISMNKFSKSLARELRGFFRDHYNRKLKVDAPKILSEMPFLLMQRVREQMLAKELKAIPFLSHVRAKFFPRLVKVLVPRYYLPGSHIIQAGMVTDAYFYVLSKGAVQIMPPEYDECVSKKGANKVFPLALLEPVCLFGLWLAFGFGKIADYTYTALYSTSLLAIDAEDIVDEFRDTPEVLSLIKRNLVHKAKVGGPDMDIDHAVHCKGNLSPLKMQWKRAIGDLTSIAADLKLKKDKFKNMASKVAPGRHGEGSEETREQRQRRRATSKEKRKKAKLMPWMLESLSPVDHKKMYNFTERLPKIEEMLIESLKHRAAPVASGSPGHISGHMIEKLHEVMGRLEKGLAANTAAIADLKHQQNRNNSRTVSSQFHTTVSPLEKEGLDRRRGAAAAEANIPTDPRPVVADTSVTSVRNLQPRSHGWNVE